MDGAALVVATLAVVALVVAPGEITLYNGIRIRDNWPPRVEALTREPPLDPPYLAQPPEVIPIDVGRQLFVDVNAGGKVPKSPK